MSRRKETRLPALSTIESIKEALDVRLGRRGDPLDRALTIRDVVDSGLPVNAVRIQGGMGIESVAREGRFVPPAPAGFVALSIFGGIHVLWDQPPNAEKLAFTELSRSTSDDVESREVLTSTGGFSYLDMIDSQDETTYYYWVRFMSVTGNYGPFQGPVSATVMPLVEDTIERLTGRIDESILASSLNGRIDLIDGSDATPGSVAYRVRQEMLARTQALEEEAEDRIAALLAEREARESADRDLDSRVQTVTAATSQAAADINEEREARIEGDNALAASVEAYYARSSSEQQAAITQERQARTNADNALAEDVTTLRARVGTNEAAITSEEQARADADAALSSAVSSITARMNATPVWVSSFEPGADFDRWQTAVGGSIQPYAGSYAGDQAALVTHTGGQPMPSGQPGTVYAKVPESIALNFAGRRIRVTGFAKRPDTNASNQFALAYSTADVGNSGWQYFSAGENWSLFEFLWEVPEANKGGADYIGFWADTAGGGNGVLVDLMNIQIAASEEDLPTITAAIQTEQKARVAGDKSLADQITTVQSRFGDDIASVEQRLSTNVERIDGELVSMGAAYTAKVQTNGLIGGFGVYNDGSTVEAAFDVDNFWIGRTNGDKRKPFIIQGGKVYIDTAFIRDASIQEGKIGPITFGKLTATDGTPVTTAAGTLRADMIDAQSLRIGFGQVTGNLMSSARGTNGRPVWLLDRTGGFELNSTGAGGSMEQRGDRISVYDGNGRLRVRIGRL